MPNNEDLDTFRAWLEAENYAVKTRVIYLSYARRAAHALAQRGVNLRDASPDDLRAWWLSLPPGAQSRNQGRKSVLACYRALGVPDAANPAALGLSKLPPPHRLARPITADELAALLAAARRLGGDHELLAVALATTGCRFNELVLARHEDFDLGAEPSWLIVNGKGSGRRGPKPRRVPLHPVFVEVLGRNRPDPPRGYVFPSPCRADTPWTDQGLRASIFYKITAEAGLEGVTPHRIRHTVATLSLAGTKDLRAVQELLGHASVATTQLYTSVSASRVSEAVEVLDVAAPSAHAPAPRRLKLVIPIDQVPAEDDDGPWPYDALVDALVLRAGEVFAAVSAYRHRDDLDTSPHERACLEVGLCKIEDALDAIEGGMYVIEGNAFTRTTPAQP